jgi:hypothetical protein
MLRTYVFWKSGFDMMNLASVCSTIAETFHLRTVSTEPGTFIPI